MMIPTELITFGASFIARAVQQHMAYKQANDAAERQFALTAAGIKVKAVRETQNLFNKNNLFGWTCSILALMAFFSIVLLPKIAVMIDPGMAIGFGHTSEEPGSSILWGLIEFSTAHTSTEIIPFKGIFITPVESHLLASIAGMFFGGINIRRKN